MEIDGVPATEIKEKDLFKAAESGGSSVFKSLSEEQLLKASSFRNEDGRSLLHAAVSSSQNEVQFTAHIFLSMKIVYGVLIFVRRFITVKGMPIRLCRFLTVILAQRTHGDKLGFRPSVFSWNPMMKWYALVLLVSNLPIAKTVR